MRARGRGSRCRPVLLGPCTLADAWQTCPFRSVIAAGDHDLPGRIRGGFAAIGGEVEPIGSDHLAELVAVVRGGGAIVVAGSTKELRDAAKRQVVAALHGAAGTA